MNAAPAVTRPDLAPLLESDPETVAHIILAEAGGAVWGSMWSAGELSPTLRLPAANFDDYLGVPSADGSAFYVHDLPRPLHDDGDAWRLMVRERIDLECGDGFYSGSWDKGPNALPRFGYVDHAAPRRAAVLAALHKHAHDPRWSDLIPSVIERLEQ